MQAIYSLSDINTRAIADRGFEIELEYPVGHGLGIFLTVLGEHSDIVEQYEIERADRRAQEQLASAKTGEVKVRTVKEVLQNNRESAAHRVIAWRGIKEEFSTELLQGFLQNNPDFVDQILEASRDRANFMLA
ncbi:hypothetical protein [Alcaligenes sp. WGS1538]|uniref:hypothetical protein n=1 Tax=Alcaligenes sp. WGS1538 TaxID=3366811 RepID=UPI00372D78AC